MGLCPRSLLADLLEIKQPQDGKDLLKFYCGPRDTVLMNDVCPRLFYHLKKVIENEQYARRIRALISFQDLFPWVYFNYYVGPVVDRSLRRQTDK